MAGIPPGTLLGSYEVLAPIGSGGMGEVYRARDTRLGRTVALKVLPDRFAADPDRIARFTREAQVLASLNHPHIAAIYGLEDAGGRRALVLELVEGETLADQIARGPIPLDDALPIARQIAEALAAAHEQGIVHRDLKPANVKVDPAGRVKVLDFGLAKLAEQAPPEPAAAVSMSPTITSPVLTGAGMLLGTAAYMSPEQVKGRPADKRSDGWAFGAVLYEMLTGRRLFDGEDVADTLANVLKAEPDWSRLRPDVPGPVRVLLRRCLAKDPRERCRDMSAALLVLEEYRSLSADVPAAAPPSSRQNLWVPVVGIAAAAAVGAIAATAWTRSGTPPASPSVVRSVLPVAGDAQPRVEFSGGRTVAITPDASRVVFLAEDGRVFVRPLDADLPTLLLEHDGARSVFTSPDNQWAAVFDNANALVKVPLSGVRQPIPIVQADGNPRGGAWVGSSIVYATTSAAGLQRVSDSGGGAVADLTTPDRENGEADHLWPAPLPGGDAVLFTITRQDPREPPHLAVLDLISRRITRILEGGSSAMYLESGHLLYVANDTLRVVPFDLAARTVSGSSVPVLEGVAVNPLGFPMVDVAADGTLVFLRGSGNPARVPVWVDRTGKERAIEGAPGRRYTVPRVSPHGDRLVFHEVSGVSDYNVHVLDLSRGIVDRVTTQPGRNSEPVWSPNARQIAYYATGHDGGPGVFVRRADGTGDPERLTTGTHLPLQWLKSGVVYIDFGERAITPNTAEALAVVVPETKRSRVILKGRPGRVSPDERWVASTRTVDGVSQVYVMPLPGLETQARISRDGGRDPVWAPDARTLFYRRDTSIIAVDVVGPDPQKWTETVVPLQGRYRFELGPTLWDVGPSGDLLLIREASQDSAANTQLWLYQNWFDEVRAMVGAN